MRIRLDFAYDGSDFSGWAAQPGLRTVEGELSCALGRILRADPAPSLTVAGRTDAGVHARGAVAHLDVDPDAWESLRGRSDLPADVAALRRLRGVLPADIIVRRASAVCGEFDARFSAVSRRYSYRICDQPELLDPLRRRDTVTVRRPLDVEAMVAAAASLTGLRDFAAFCKHREGATTVRTLLDYSWRREGHLLIGTVLADAFCHSMVRALVGGVIPVGEGRKPVEWAAQVLDAGVRDGSVTVMPAHGLCLEEVVYPPESEFAARARTARAIRTLPASER